MIVTVRTADGGKITKDSRDIIIVFGKPFAIEPDLLKRGAIYINAQQIVDVRMATPEEVEHSKNHGW